MRPSRKGGSSPFVPPAPLIISVDDDTFNITVEFMWSGANPAAWRLWGRSSIDGTASFLMEKSGSSRTFNPPSGPFDLVWLHASAPGVEQTGPNSPRVPIPYP